MTVTLVGRCRLSRDLHRLERALPRLSRVYDGLVLVVPSRVAPDSFRDVRHVARTLVVAERSWTTACHRALETSLDLPGAHVHFCDLGRLLTDVESRPDELPAIVEAIRQSDCLVIGRSQQTFQTCPQPLRQTDEVVNAVFSRWLGRWIDLCGEARGFSREAARFIVRSGLAGPGENVAWPMLLHRAGFRVDYLALDGPGWIGGRSRRCQPGSASSPGTRQRNESSPRQWVRLVRDALEMVQAGLSALQCPLEDVGRNDALEQGELRGGDQLATSVG